MIASTIPLEKQIAAPCAFCKGFGWLYTTMTPVKCGGCAGYGYIVTEKQCYDPGEVTIRWRTGSPPASGNYLAFWPSSRAVQAQFKAEPFPIWYGPSGSEAPLYWAPLPVPAMWARTGLEIEIP